MWGDEKQETRRKKRASKAAANCEKKKGTERKKWKSLQ